jgi:ribosomal protein L11 methyltransferase
MAYLALSLALADLDAEAVEVACLEAGALSVTLTDAADDAILEPRPGELRLWPQTTLQALFEAERATPALIAGLAARLGIAAAQLSAQFVAERAWEREWLRDYHAMRFGTRLWVAPRHEAVAVRLANPDAIVVELDPGLAFGTGTHPSTALCLEWLEAHLQPGAAIIDYGCGSGILAIAALKLGARTAQCFDIDPQALTATRDNAIANGCSAALQSVARDAELRSGADLLLANIISDTLCELAPRFAQLLRPGGSLVMAGLLREQADAVTAACSAWFDIQPQATLRGWGIRGDWTALAAKRRA